MVVGIDGSVSCLDAVRVAVREAARLRTSLRLVHAFIWPLLAMPLAPPLLGQTEESLRQEARRMLAEAAAMAHQTDPAVPVERRLVIGAPAPTLVEQAAGTALVVLGDRGLGGFTGLLVGSVAVQLAAHSPAPVMVVKGNTAAEGPVVVGVDGSAGSLRTLEWALREAAARKAPLHAVHVTSSRDEAPVLARTLAGLDVSDVEVRSETVAGHAARHLIGLSEQAQLVVVGSRGLGGFAGLLLGSVSQHLLHHAQCPLLIVPHGRDQRM